MDGRKKMGEHVHVLEDGTVVFAKQGTTEKDYKGAVIDISGLKF